MKRIAATALFATVSLLNAARAQEPAWGPSGGGTPVPTAPPPAVVQPKPLIEPKPKLPDVVLPAPAATPMPAYDNPGWLPARRYNPDVPPVPAPKPVLAPKEDSNPFRPVTAPSIPTESPFKEVPTVEANSTFERTGSASTDPEYEAERAIAITEGGSSFHHTQRQYA